MSTYMMSFIFDIVRNFSVLLLFFFIIIIIFAFCLFVYCFYWKPICADHCFFISLLTLETQLSRCLGLTSHHFGACPKSKPV